MKVVTKSSLIGALGAVALLALSANAAYAGTDSGTTIGNTATVSYDVGGVSQTPIESSPTGNSNPGAGNGTSTDFKVDKKLALSVVTQDTELVSVVPGETDAVTTFKVSNLGNSAQSAWLTAVKQTTGTNDPFGNVSGGSDFEVSTAQVYGDTNNNGTYDPGTDNPITNISSLAQAGASGDSATVFVVSEIPASVGDGEFGVVGLVAQVGAPGGAAITSDDSGKSWDPDTVQRVFAETSDTGVGNDTKPYDGYASDSSGYIVNSAVLTIKKTASVVSDPVSRSGNAPASYQPKAIPGAYVQYTITVSNASGASDATNIVVSDDLSTQIGNGNLAYRTGTIEISTPANGNTPTSCTDGADSDQCEFTSNTVTVDSITLSGGEQAVVTFEVEIQ